MQLTRLMNQLARLTAIFALFFALGVEHLPAQTRAPRPAPQRAARPSGLFNPSQMVMTSQGVMHRVAAARLGLPGTPLPTSPGGTGGTQDPNTRR